MRASLRFVIAFELCVLGGADRMLSESSVIVRNVQPLAPDGAQPGTVPITLHLPISASQLESIEAIVLTPRDSSASDWRVLDRRFVRVHAGRVDLAERPGQMALVILQRRGEQRYLLHGPLRWPSAPDEQIVDPIFRRTAGGHLPSGFTDAVRLAWLPAEDDAAPAPRCAGIEGSSWRCLGLPLDASGVVLALDAESLASAVIRRDAQDRGLADDLQRVSWGRLVRVSWGTPSSSSASGIRASAWRPAASSRQRPVTRLRLVPDPGIAITHLTPSAFWVSGDRVPEPGQLIQVEGPNEATNRTAMTELSWGSPEIPFILDMSEEVAFNGRVESATGRPAAGALVIVSEIIREQDDVLNGDKNPVVRRRQLAEERADMEGVFAIRGVGSASYELIVLHDTMGRAQQVVRARDSPFVVRLRAPHQVRGRTVHAGTPIEGAPVLVVPDLSEFAGAPDPLDQFALGAVSDASGRFSVSLPPEGTSELRIGNDQTGFVRRRVGRSRDLPDVTDLGDIELVGGLRLTVVLDALEACRLQAIGPIGTGGMHIVPVASVGPGLWTVLLPETGRWSLLLLCGADEIAPVPAFVDVPPDREEMTVTLTLPSR